MIAQNIVILNLRDRKTINLTKKTSSSKYSNKERLNHAIKLPNLKTWVWFGSTNAY